MLKRDTIALYLAARDPRTPWYAKLLAAAVVACALSPIDLIPDFIPFLGYLDDVILAAVVVDGVLNFIDRPLVLRYWPGSADSLERIAAVARRLARWVPNRIKARIFGSSPLSPRGRGQGEGVGGEGAGGEGTR